MTRKFLLMSNRAAIVVCSVLAILAFTVPLIAAEPRTGGWQQRITKPAAPPRRSTKPKRQRKPAAKKRRRAKPISPGRKKTTPQQRAKHKRGRHKRGKHKRDTGPRPVRVLWPSPTASSHAFKPPPVKSTLGPIMAETSGDNAPYIAFDQGQYLTALRLAKAGAERNQPQALTLMGRIHELGLGVPKNESQAAELYQRGLQLGDIDATFALAVMLTTGRGIKKNTKTAAQFFELAARAGHPEANYNLGLLFISGIGKPENSRRALLHLEYAAKKGIAAAQYDLAALYRNGHGTNPDAYKATHWLRAAAKSGMAEAQYEYAVALLQGRGFNKDKPDILIYLTNSARQGMPGAQNRLAHLYAEGKLIRRNTIEAAKWRFIAMASGYKTKPHDKVLDRQIAQMNPADRQRAVAIADGFIDGARLRN